MNDKPIEENGTTRQLAEVGAVEVLHCMCGDTTCGHCGGRAGTCCGARRTHRPTCGNPLGPALNAEKKT